MNNNVDSSDEAKNTNDEERTIPPGYYSIAEIIVILNSMTDSTFSISTKDSRYGCIWMQYLFSIYFTMPQIFEKLSDWKDERSFYPFRSTDRM